MAVLRVVPNLTVPDAAAAAASYGHLLGLVVVMDLGWVITLADAADSGRQLNLLTRDASAAVNADVSVEVDDVDAAYAAARQAGLEIVHELTDEQWDVRRFFVRDGGGNVVNILAHRSEAPAH